MKTYAGKMVNRNREQNMCSRILDRLEGISRERFMDDLSVNEVCVLEEDLGVFPRCGSLVGGSRLGRLFYFENVSGFWQWKSFIKFKFLYK